VYSFRDTGSDSPGKFVSEANGPNLLCQGQLFRDKTTDGNPSGNEVGRICSSATMTMLILKGLRLMLFLKLHAMCHSRRPTLRVTQHSHKKLSPGGRVRDCRTRRRRPSRAATVRVIHRASCGRPRREILPSPCAGSVRRSRWFPASRCRCADGTFALTSL
jgi:hypothetical protein